MHKTLLKIMIILGGIFSIAAYIGASLLILFTGTLPSTSIAIDPPINNPADLPSNNFPLPAFKGLPINVFLTVKPFGHLVASPWISLGMHFYQADYSQFQLLGPYRAFKTQLVAREEEHRLVTNASPENENLPQQMNPAVRTNFLNGYPTIDTHDYSNDNVIAESVTAVDIKDNAVRNASSFFVVEVQDNTGRTLAMAVNLTRASTEMSCYLCHVSNDIQGVFNNILNTHDTLSNTNLVSQAQGGMSVQCNSCHSNLATGVIQNNRSQITLSGAMHSFHADKLVGTQLPENLCQSCHPGPQTQCLGDIMNSAGITCTDCHGGMTDVGDPNRVSWVSLPACTNCHSQSQNNSTTSQVDDPGQNHAVSVDALMHNNQAQVDSGIYCAVCHDSPNITIPTTSIENMQSIGLQGQTESIVECEVCHLQKPDEAVLQIRGDD